MALWRRQQPLGSEFDRATFRTLHVANLASSALRDGLTEVSAAAGSKHLRTLLGSPALALTDTAGALAWEGVDSHHDADALALIGEVLESGKPVVRKVNCPAPACPIRHAIAAPLTVEDRTVGTLQVYSPESGVGLVRAAYEVADWVSGQLALAELDASRNQLIEAEVRALRAQISPHFIYNSLAAIASFVRTDPDRARHLLLEFADFTRYSFRRHGEFTTLAEELKSIERYLVLEQARFGDRLQVTLRIAPEVLQVAVPFLCIQPLVENAVRHGLNDQQTGHVRIDARDAGNDAVIEVEDDGVGEEPETVRRALAGDIGSDSVGLGNVDARLRTNFGDDYGLVVETAPRAGTKVIVRVPKFALRVTS